MPVLDWTAFGVIVLASAGLVLNQQWRWNMVFLAAVYLGFFWLIQISWSIPLAVGKLVTGWMICAILGIAHLNSPEEEITDQFWSQGRAFRLMVIALILVITFLGADWLMDWLGMVLPAAWGGVFLVGMGLLLAGSGIQPNRVVIGLLVTLSGFEVIYAALESSSLVTALLAFINLGLALVGAYFLTHQFAEELS